MMIGWFIMLSSTLEVVEGLVAMLTCYLALRFYSLARERLFLALFTSFLILGLGLLIHGLAAGVVLLMAPRLRPSTFVLTLRSLALTLSICEAFAYGLLAYSYTRYGAPRHGGQTGQGVLPSLMLMPALAASPTNSMGQEVVVGLVRFHPLLEGLILAILAYLAFKTISNFLSEKDVNPFLVSFSFLFLAAARVCFVLAFSLTILYITAHVLQLLAFLSLLIVLLRVVRA